MRLPLLLYLLTWITTTAVAGLWFSVPLMLILSCHECGHFVQSRRYGVQASLPYFIPMPFGPFGTLGAVIVMGGRIPSSRALFDIGISGPIAGLVPTLLCCYYGIKWSLVAPLHSGDGDMVFGDPLLFAWMTRAIHGQLASDIVLFAHPVAMAGWVGLLLTSLNLIPLGQLDGGHVLHALCGHRSALIARVIFYILVILVLLFQWWHWVLLLVLIAMMGIVHPPTQNDAVPLGWTRRLLGCGMLAFIVIGLTPVPLDMETNNNNNSNDDDARPNVIIIYIDDMGYADIGSFGGEIPTPNLDRLATEGRRFTNFLVSSAVCSASRSAIMTGCYHRRVGIAGAFNHNARIGLDPDEETIAEICRREGYATACFGKWHLGHLPPFLPTSQGFDEYFGLPYSNDMWPHHPETSSYPPLPLFDGTTVVNNNVDAATQQQLTTWYTERAVSFIERNKNRPFFLYLPHTMVHVPLFVSDKFAGKSGLGLFGDVVMEVDWSVGEIVMALRRCGLDRKTLLIFTSDNGPWLSYGDHAGSARPLREGKGTSFEGGVRVPMVAWFPGRIPAGTECRELAATIDLLPTVTKLIGGTLPPRRIDGHNIVPLLLGEPNATSPHNAYPIYYNGLLQAIRDTRWKLVFPHVSRTLGEQSGGNGGIPAKYQKMQVTSALYDLENDIGETTDVSAAHGDVVTRLSTAADAIRADLGDGNKMGPGVRRPRSIPRN